MSFFGVELVEVGEAMFWCELVAVVVEVLVGDSRKHAFHLISSYRIGL